MKVVELKPALDCHNIASALRNIADDIEAGAYDFAPSMAVLVLGREEETQRGTELTMRYDWQTHGLGKAGFFAAKGLLAAAISKFETGEG